MRKLASIKVVLCAFALVGVLSADIGPPTASYTVTGTSGDYTLDFTVNNNTNQDIYGFGVLLSSPDITGIPAGFIVYPSTFNPSTAGGSNTTYNTIWVDATFSIFSAGTTLSGFEATVSDSVAPTSVNWFAAGIGPPDYTGGGNFGSPGNPGFEGVASAGAVTPEPSYLAVAAGIIGLIGFRKLRMKQQQDS